MSADPSACLGAAEQPGSAIHLASQVTYTILVSSDDTAGRFCLIDMFGPPGGSPPPHRRDFEETFYLLEGELAFAFRGVVNRLWCGRSLKDGKRRGRSTNI